MWGRRRKEQYELMRVYLQDTIKSLNAAEEHRWDMYERYCDSRKETIKLRAALKRIDSATMSQYTSTDDMLRDVKRITKGALKLANED